MCVLLLILTQVSTYSNTHSLVHDASQQRKQYDDTSIRKTRMLFIGVNFSVTGPSYDSISVDWATSQMFVFGQKCISLRYKTIKT